MCLIIYKPAGAKLDLDAVKNGADSHPDGSGFMVRTEKGLYYQKGLWDFKRVKKHVKHFDAYDLGIHFRSATTGKINQDNCHPFKGTSWTMMHNGMINGFGTSEKSDTADFAEFIEQMFRHEAPREGKFYQSIIGYSKLLFATTKGDWVIVNEQMGIWDNGIWYSNTSYKESTTKWKPNYPIHTHYPCNNFYYNNHDFNT